MDNSNNIEENENSFQIYDTDSTVGYTGSWVQNTFTIPNQTEPQTSHSTAEPNAAIFIPFNGSTLHLFGVIPPGSGDISANYSIDDGQPNTRAVPLITQDTPEFYQQFFVSPLLDEGPHNLTIKVLETGKGRNYTFHFVNVSSEDSSVAGNSDQAKSGNDQDGTRSTAIVGGVLGTVILLLIGLFTVYHLRVQRRIRLKANDNTMEQQPNAPNASRTFPTSLLSEQSVTGIYPYLLPEAESRREPTFAPSSRRVSALTSPPAYATIDAPSESSTRAQTESFTTRASYVSSGNEPLDRRGK